MPSKYYCPKDFALVHSDIEYGPGEWSGIRVAPEGLTCSSCGEIWSIGDLLKDPIFLGPGVDPNRFDSEC